MSINDVVADIEMNAKVAVMTAEAQRLALRAIESMGDGPPLERAAAMMLMVSAMARLLAKIEGGTAQETWIGMRECIDDLIAGRP